MATRRQSRRKAKRLFRLCVADGTLDERRVRHVVQRVADDGGRAGRAILKHLVRLVKLDRARHAARVESAAPLPADLQASLRAGLERRYGPGLTIDFAQRAELIGGVRIRVGNDVYDGSVAAGLAELAKRF
jgi:F-type H+-transporting ATPase subunit delta